MIIILSLFRVSRKCNVGRSGYEHQVGGAIRRHTAYLGNETTWQTSSSRQQELLNSKAPILMDCGLLLYSDAGVCISMPEDFIKSTVSRVSRIDLNHD